MISERWKRLKKVKDFGPGIVTGGADNDPAGIVTYTSIGATTGLSQLWLMLFSTPMMIAVQDTASRIAIVTGKSLSEVLVRFYSKKVAIPIVMTLLIANLFTIAADIDAIAVVLQIITGIKSIYWLIPLTAFLAYLVIFKQYRTIKRVLLMLTASLSVYIFSAIIARPDLGDVIVNTFIPHIRWNIAYAMAALGLLGTTISPYMLFWQAAEEKIEHKSVVQIHVATWDTIAGMTYSNVVAYFIIIAAAYTLFGRHLELNSVKDAAMALKPFAGRFAFLIFSFGIITGGLLALPVLAGSSAYAVADLFGWREGFEGKVSDAKGFYIVFLGSLLIGDIIDLSRISAVDALYYSQVLDGILLPFLVFVLMKISNDSRIMGDYTNTKFNNIFSIVTFITASVFSIVLFFQLFR